MRKQLSVLIALCLVLCFAARAEAPRVILYSAYEQRGWGDRVQAGFIDEDGGVWTLSGFASNMGWPGDPEKQPGFLSSAQSREPVGTLSHDDLFALKSLIGAVEDQGSSLKSGMMNDYGISRSYAVRYDSDGKAHGVLLGAYGDSAFANTDANAEGLYYALMLLFANQAEREAIQERLRARSVSLSGFIGYDPDALENARLTALLMDCEEGPIPVELSEAEEADIRRLARYGRVTIKANAIETTGGFTCYAFLDDNGQALASFDLYSGLLYTSDGMYYIVDGAS